MHVDLELRSPLEFYLPIYTCHELGCNAAKPLGYDLQRLRVAPR
jgi:hypothetical protein